MACSEECYFISLMVWYLPLLEAGFIFFLPVQFESFCFGLAKNNAAVNKLWRIVWKLLFSQLDCRRNSDSSVRDGKVQRVKHVFVSKHMVGVPEAGAVNPICESRRGITLGLAWGSLVVSFAAELHISISPCTTSFLSQETCRNAWLPLCFWDFS